MRNRCFVYCVVLFLAGICGRSTVTGGALFGSVSRIGAPFQAIIDSVSEFVHSVSDDISYRKSSAVQYRDKLRSGAVSMFDRFRISQSIISHQTQHELEQYMNQLNQIYSDTLASLQQQRKNILELEKNIPKRPKQIDESLDRFRKFYDESIMHKIVTMPKELQKVPSPAPPALKKLRRRPVVKVRRGRGGAAGLLKQGKVLQTRPRESILQKIQQRVRTGLYSKTSVRLKEENLFRDVTRGWEETSASFSIHMDLLAGTLQQQWSYLTHSISDLVGIDPAGKEGGPVGSQIQSQVGLLLQEFTTFQEEVTSRASDIVKRSQQAIEQSLSKPDLLREKLELESQFHALERSVNAWVEEKFNSMEAQVKALQEKLKISNSLYEELVGKRQAEAEYSQKNDETLRRILALIDPAEDGWKFINGESGIQVYRKFFTDGPSREYACVMCNGTINSPPQKVMALLSDTGRVKEYNSLYESGKDITVVSDDTRVLWVTTPPVFPLKPRDFCTVWHVRRLKDGTCVVLNRAVEHPLVPVTRNYVRASIVLGASIIQPVPGDPRRSRLTMITQLNPGGFAPPAVVNFLCTMGPIGFMKNVEVASKHIPARTSTTPVRVTS